MRFILTRKSVNRDYDKEMDTLSGDLCSFKHVH